MKTKEEEALTPKEVKALAKLGKIVRSVMDYTPPPGSLKKPVKAPSKAELLKGWKLKM